MDKSLVVLGKTLEDAIHKAAALLHCQPGQVLYEILQKPKPSKLGFRSIPCKIKASIVPFTTDNKPQFDEEPPVQTGFGLPMPWPESDIDHVPPDWYLQELEDAISQYVSPEQAAEITVDTEQKAERLENNKVIKEDIRISQSPIDFFDWNLLIKGEVPAGVKIRVTGNLFIEGEVESAYLEAGLDIGISDTLRGTAISKNGNVICNRAWDARIDAQEGDVTIRDTAFQSEIHAQRNVIIGQVLLGGICYGESLVDVKVAGSESGIPTIIYGGPNKQLTDEINSIRERAVKLATKLAEYSRVQQKMQPVEERGEMLSTAERIELWEAATSKAVINDILARLSRRKHYLLGLVNVDKTARVSIKDRAYAKVRIIVDDAPLELQNVTHYAAFTKDYNTGKLRMTSYK